MKKSLKRVLSILLAVLFIAGFAVPGNVQAATPRTLRFLQNVVFLEGRQSEISCYIGYGPGVDPESVTILSVKSSKQKIIGIDKINLENGKYHFIVVPKKLGKSKITLTYKYKGKKKTIKSTLTVENYVTPFKALTINGKKVNLSKDNNAFGYTINNYKKKNIKLKVASKKGYRLIGSNVIDGIGVNKSINIKKLSKGVNVKLSSAATFNLYLSYEDGKGNIVTYVININR